MKVIVVVWYRFSSVYYRGVVVGIRGFVWFNLLGICNFSWGFKGDLVCWYGCMGVG